MVLADWIAILVFLGAGVLGALFGFGKLLKFFTKGIVGFFISFVVVYFFLGVVSSWPFVQDLMLKMHTLMVNADNAFVNFLIKIGIEKIILAIIMFIVVQLIRILIVSLIKGFVEIDKAPIKVINKVLGTVLMIAVAIMVCLIVFQIVAWVGGESAINFSENMLAGGKGKGVLYWLYNNNPLNALFAKIGN